MTKAAETKLKAKAKKKAGKGDDDDNDDDDEDAYTALSKSMFTNGAGPKPPIGSFESCAKCEKQFTVASFQASLSGIRKAKITTRTLLYRQSIPWLHILPPASCATNVLKRLAQTRLRSQQLRESARRPRKSAR